MKRTLMLVLSLAFIGAACTGGSEDATPTTVGNTAATTAGPDSGPATQTPATAPPASTPPVATTTPTPTADTKELQPSTVETTVELGDRWTATNLIDGDPTTEWQYDTMTERRVILSFRFDVPVSISAIEIHNLPNDSRFLRNHRIRGYNISACCSELAEIFGKLADSNTPQTIATFAGDFTGFVEFEITSTYAGEDVDDAAAFDELAVADIKFFGRRGPTQGEGVATGFCQFAATADGPHLAPLPGLDRLMADILPSLAPKHLGAALVKSVSDFQQALQLAPGEVRNDVATVAGYLATFTELLEEFAYDIRPITALGENDPRRVAIEQAGPAFLDAQDRLATYCDVSLEDALIQAAEAAGIAGGVPESLRPPSMTDSSYLDVGIWIVSTTATFDEVVAAYTESVGAPFITDPGQAIWNAEIDGNVRVVLVFDQGGSAFIQIIYFG
jgi:hypothetical protein